MMNFKDCGAFTPVDFSELPVDANYSIILYAYYQGMKKTGCK